MVFNVDPAGCMERETMGDTNKMARVGPMASLMCIAFVAMIVVPLIVVVDGGPASLGGLFLLDGIATLFVLRVVVKKSASAVVAVLLCVSVGPLIAVCVWLCITTEVEVMGQLFRKYPTPRPMFSNGIGQHEFALLPSWYEDPPLSDEDGHRMWCDFGDNVVLIVSSSPDEQASSIYRLRAGVKSTDVWVDPNKEGQCVSILRMRDRIVVVAVDGTIRSFKNMEGSARRLYDHCRTSSVKSFIGEVEAFLSAEEVNAFRKAYRQNERSRSEGQSDKASCANERRRFVLCI